MTSYNTESGNLKVHLLDFLEASNILAVNSFHQYEMHLYDMWRRPLLCILWFVSTDVWDVEGRSMIFCSRSSVFGYKEAMGTVAAPCLRLGFLCLQLSWRVFDPSSSSLISLSPFWMWWRQQLSSRVSVSCSGVIHRGSWSLHLQSF